MLVNGFHTWLGSQKGDTHATRSLYGVMEQVGSPVSSRWFGDLGRLVSQRIWGMLLHGCKHLRPRKDMCLMKGIWCWWDILRVEG